MPLYKIRNKNLIQIKEKKIDFEKNLQELTEINLEEIFELQFVVGSLNKQLIVQNFEIDTLAFDKETKSFVIIEYKRDRSFSIVDQGFNYLALMLNKKADFILEYNERNKTNIRRSDIDWSQSRIIFIAPKFTSHQKGSIAFKDLPIELWEVKLFENNLISYSKIKTPETSESIKKISKSKILIKVSKEIRTYSLDDHIKKHWVKSKNLYEILSQKILDIDSRFEIRPVKYYIGFNIENKVVFNIKIRASKILLELYRVKPKDLEDPEKRTRYRKNSFKYYNKHITQFDINNEEDIYYAVLLIKQVYKKFFK